MKGILVTSDCEIKEVDLPAPLYESAGDLLGGSMEHVTARRLERPYCLLINGEGGILGLPENKVGCYLFETEEHGYPLFGDILIMKERWTSEGVDFTGLAEEDIASVTEMLEDVLMEVDEY